MRKQTLLFAAGACVLAGACSRTADGDVVVNRPSDVQVKTTQDTLHLPTVGTKVDTINAPVIGTKTETLVVKKPVIGTQKTTVKVPTIKKP